MVNPVAYEDYVFKNQQIQKRSWMLHWAENLVAKAVLFLLRFQSFYRWFDVLCLKCWPSSMSKACLFSTQLLFFIIILLILSYHILEFILICIISWNLYWFESLIFFLLGHLAFLPWHHLILYRCMLLRSRKFANLLYLICGICWMFSVTFKGICGFHCFFMY